MKKEHDGQFSRAPGESGGQNTGDAVTTERYPGLDERLRNIETHIAIRYGEPHYRSCVLVYFTAGRTVPSLPHSLLDRLKFLEDHLVRLEKEYPPWAALHFNQPHRGVRIDSKCDCITTNQLIVATTAASYSYHYSVASYRYYRSIQFSTTRRHTRFCLSSI